MRLGWILWGTMLLNFLWGGNKKPEAGSLLATCSPAESRLRFETELGSLSDAVLKVCVHSFMHLFIHWFIHSFIHSIAGSSGKAQASKWWLAQMKTYDKARRFKPLNIHILQVRNSMYHVVFLKFTLVGQLIVSKLVGNSFHLL